MVWTARPASPEEIKARQDRARSELEEAVGLLLLMYSPEEIKEVVDKLTEAK